MAIPRVKSTYSLDVETVEALERMSRTWGVSRSEALRRAIRASSGASPPLTPLATLDALQKSAGLRARAAAAWVARVRAERRAGGRRIRSSS